MATTLGQLLGRVHYRLSGVGALEDAVTELPFSIGTTDRNISVDDAGGFSPGTIEIDFEMMRLRSVDATTNLIVVSDYGRGIKGTTMVAHDVGAEVTFNPLWPKGVVAQEINGVLHEVYPDLYAVKAVETTIPSDLGPLAVPLDATDMISVWYEPVGAPGTWERSDHWDFNPDSDDAGRTLRLRFGFAGQAIRLVYAARPGVFTLTGATPLTQDFETVTGLDERVADLIALGVACRLAPFIPLAKMVSAGAEARADEASRTDPTSGAKLLYSEFRARVQAEQTVLVREHPIRVHSVRR